MQRRVNLIPVSGKQPIVKDWTKWSERAMTDAEEQELAETHFDKATGLGAVCGYLGLQCIDFDLNKKDGADFFDRWKAMVHHANASLLSKLVVVKTPSGGRHAWFMCEDIEGNKKLARTTPRNCIIETRGMGGQALVPPSPGYEYLHGESINNVQMLSKVERALLLACAKALDQVEDPMPKPQRTDVEGGSKIIDDFNASNMCEDILEANGWTRLHERGERVWYLRPGDPSSATSGNVHTGLNIFYCWTSSSELLPSKAYSPFGLFAIFEHRGDHSAAFRQIAELQVQSAGKTRKNPDPAPVEARVVEGPYRFKMSDEVTHIKSTLRVVQEFKTYDVLGQGMLHVIGGERKTNKTTVMRAIAASMLKSGAPVAGWSYTPEPGLAAWFDTEQAKPTFQLTMASIVRMAGLTEMPDWFHAYHVKPYNLDMRLAYIDSHVQKFGSSLKTMFIDGLVDLCRDFMDSKRSRDLSDKIMEWQDYGITIHGVLHTTPNSGSAKLRGHLGTEMHNKADAVTFVEKLETLPENFRLCRPSDVRNYEPWRRFEFFIDDRFRPGVDWEHDYQQPSPDTGPRDEFEDEGIPF